MKKTWKKIFAIVGIIMVIATTLIVPISADDGANNPQPTRNDLYNLQRMYLEGEKVMTVGSPFTVFAYGDTFDSQDRFSVYTGNGEYQNIQMIHWGEKKDHSGYPYYKVRTQYDSTFAKNSSEWLQIEYEDLLYWGGFSRDLARSTENGTYTSSSLDYSLIPYFKFRYTGAGEAQIKVTYAYTIYEQVDIATPDGKERVYREKQVEDNVTYNSERLKDMCIPLFPVYWDETTYNDMFFGKTGDEIRDGTIINIGELYTIIEIGSEFYDVEQVSYFDTYEMPGYKVNMTQWVNQNGLEIYKNIFLEVDVSNFLLDSVSGFMGFELYPGLSLIGIIGFLIAIPLLMLILKVFKD